MPIKKSKPDAFVDWFRSSSPYIHAHRGRTFVIVFGGEAVVDDSFSNLIHDIALLHSLGIKLVLVHGARPQIEQRLNVQNAQMQYINGLRVTDAAALACVKEAAGMVRVEIEALLSMGLANSPMAGARIRVTSGNFVAARPLGVRDGVDYGHTGEVRRIDTAAICQQLEMQNMVLIPPLGYSPTGEVFNLCAADLGAAVATALSADKLIMLMEGKGLVDSRNRLITNIIAREVEAMLTRRKNLSEDIVQHLHAAINACRRGVKRIHLLGRELDGVLLRELFSRDGAGSLITAEPYEDVRTACIDDVGGILELLAPLEESGKLVRRSRDLLETEIDHFTVVERDGMVIACTALYPHEKESLAELACLAVHPDFQNNRRGESLLQHMESRARSLGIEGLFVLTTQATHWFRERGFEVFPLQKLPMKKRQLYNYRRNAKVFFKKL